MKDIRQILKKRINAHVCDEKQFYYHSLDNYHRSGILKKLHKWLIKSCFENII